ncbi:MAG: TlpA family protein disulfide reductase [Acidobacteriia bacterium]|nr:TlpA family protein disulfide reductase [Terriglobia bacterium]
MDTIALDNANAQAPIRPRLSVKTILGIAVLAAFTVFITWRARVLEIALREQPALVDKQAPDFSASTLDGRTVSLADFRGQKKVVVSFWASWCGPCRLEMPDLIKFYKKNHNDSSDFEILAVSIDEDVKDAADFATKQKLNFPVLLDPRQKIANSYDVDGIPTMFVIDKDGKVTYGRIGYDAGMEFRLTYALGIKDKKPAEGEP